MTKYLDFEGLKHFKKKIDAEYKPALNGKADNDIGIFNVSSTKYKCLKIW